MSSPAASSASSPVRIVRSSSIWEITLDRPKANAIDAATSTALAQAFMAFRDDANARVAILTGGGEKFFSAGWDLKDAAASGAEGDHGPGGFAGLTELFDLNKPVIAAINGLAVGGGFELALACDLIVAGSGVEFFLPEATIGVIPDAGGILRLPRRLPHAIAMEMMLTGKRLSTADALRFGLINAIAAPGQLMAEARALAERIAASAPLSVMAIKAVLARTQGLSVEDGYRAMRSGIAPYERMKRSADYFEGAKAFAEKTQTGLERPLMPRLAEIAKALGAEFTGDGNAMVAGINHPSLAGPDDMALAMEDEALAALRGSRARTAILKTGKNAEANFSGMIVTEYPRYAMAGLTKLFARPPRSTPGIHAMAIVDPTAEVATPVSIGPFVEIGAGARIGPRATILGQVTIGAGARIGSDALIYPGVRIGERVEIGERVILHPNASIGADGFSFAIPEPGKPPPPGQAPIQRIASLGNVVIGNDVEVGANSCIDRGTIEATTIGNGTKIDNLVMIGHNNQIGQHCLIAGHVGISGSCRIGNGVILAGAAGIADHVRIGDGAVVLAAAAVGGSRIAPGAVVAGVPAIPVDRFLEQLKHLYRLKRLYADVAALKAQMKISDKPETTS